MATINVQIPNRTNGLTIKSLMTALSDRNGFARVDDLFVAIYARQPLFRPESKPGARDGVSELHQFIDDLEEKCTTTKTLALEGTMERAAVMVSWRNKSRAGIGDEFEQTEMAKDPRPKKRERNAKDDGKEPKKETKDWMPGVALVEPEWFSRDATAETMAQEYQTALLSTGDDNLDFYNLGLGRASIKFCKPSSDGGFLVTLHVPGPITGDNSGNQ